MENIKISSVTKEDTAFTFGDYKATTERIRYSSYNGLNRGDKFVGTHSDGVTINEEIDYIFQAIEILPCVKHNLWGEGNLTFCHFTQSITEFVVCQSGCMYDLDKMGKIIAE